MKNSVKKNQTRILICLSLCSFWVGLDLLIVSPLIPSISSSLHFPIDWGGLLIAAYALLYGISAPVFGPFSDRWGRKKMIMSGLFLFSIGTLLTSIGENLTMLLLFRGLSGLGAALIMPSVYAFVGDTFDYKQRGRIMGIVTGAMGGASVLGIPLGSYLAQGTTWKTPFLIIGFSSLLILLLVYVYLPNQNRDKREVIGTTPSFFSSIQTSMANPSVLFALLCTLLWWAGFQGMFANMGSFYFRHYLVSTDWLGLIFSITGLGNIIGNIIGGRISDKIGKKKAIIICCVFSAACVFLIPTLSNYFIMVLAIHFVWSMSTGFGQASLTSFISELNPDVRGTILSLNSSATYLGMTLITTASTVILQKSGFQLLGVICSMAFLLILPIILLLVKENTSSQHTSASSTKII